MEQKLKHTFKQDFQPLVGSVEQLHPKLQRIVAPNASAMTYTGTNTYLIGNKTIGVVDPGPDNQCHLEAILEAAGSRPIKKILLTHSHIDHTALVPKLKKLTGAKVFAHQAGQSTNQKKLTIFMMTVLRVERVLIACLWLIGIC